MNDPLSNNPGTTSTPPASAWTPQQSAPITPQPASLASSPFEAPSVPNIASPSNPPADLGPVMMEPAGPKSNVWLFVVLGILIIVGLGVVASMLGWINFGSLLGMGKPTPSVVIAPSPTASVITNKNDEKRKADVANLKTQLQKYYRDKQSYPIAPTMEKTSDANSALKTALVPNYLADLPLDPLSPNSFYGYKSTDGKSYELTAALEDITDPSCIQTGNVCIYKVTDISTETPSSNTATGSTSDTTSIPTDQVTTSTDSNSSSGSSSGSASASADASANAQP